MNSTDTLSAWCRDFKAAADAAADPFRPLRELPPVPIGGEPLERLQALAAVWLTAAGTRTVDEAVQAAAGRLDRDRFIGEADGALGRPLRMLQAEIARLFDPFGVNFPATGLIPSGPFRGAFLSDHASDGTSAPMFAVNLDGLPADHWLPASIPPEQRLNGDSIILGRADFDPVSGWTPREFYATDSALHLTRTRRGEQLARERAAEHEMRHDKLHLDRQAAERAEQRNLRGRMGE